MLWCDCHVVVTMEVLREQKSGKSGRGMDNKSKRQRVLETFYRKTSERKMRERRRRKMTNRTMAHMTPDN